VTAYAELAAATNFSFLYGASHPHEMVAAALDLGHSGIGIADRNSVAGVVQAHVELREVIAEAGANAGLTADVGFKLIVGARLVFADGSPDVIA
jgi:error-prone DNA polymerase